MSFSIVSAQPHFMSSTLLLYGFIALLFGYLCGSVTTAIIVCRLMGLPDPRSIGSNNPGATNVLRTGNKLAASLTLAGDFIKGILPVLLTKWLLANNPNAVEWLPTLAGIGAFIGHLWPVFYGLKGGKGVATAFGVLAGTAWPIALFTTIVWLFVAHVSRYSALAAIISFLMAALVSAWLLDSTITVALISAMSGLLLWRHRGNIQRLLQGQESRIGVTVVKSRAQTPKQKQEIRDTQVKE